MIGNSLLASEITSLSLPPHRNLNLHLDTQRARFKIMINCKQQSLIPAPANEIRPVRFEGVAGPTGTKVALTAPGYNRVLYSRPANIGHYRAEGTPARLCSGVRVVCNGTRCMNTCFYVAEGGIQSHKMITPSTAAEISFSRHFNYPSSIGELIHRPRRLLLHPAPLETIYQLPVLHAPKAILNNTSRPYPASPTPPKLISIVLNECALSISIGQFSGTWHSHLPNHDEGYS